MNPNETLYTWSDMPVHLQAYVLGVFHANIRLMKGTATLDTLARIFNLGNPEIVIGKNQPDGGGECQLPYCRIEGERSINVMKILFTNYL